MRDTSTAAAELTSHALPESTTMSEHDAAAMHGECGGHDGSILHTPQTTQGEHRSEQRRRGKMTQRGEGKVKNAMFVWTSQMIAAGSGNDWGLD